MANTNMRNLLEEINRYPDLDTTEAIVRVVSHNVLSTLSAKSDDEWQEVDLSKLLKEANALVRASAFKKRIALQNQDALDTGLDAVKGLVFAELAKERPDLYRQLAEYVDGKKATGITEGG